jgi:ArsR family transcriptional regulator, arsenate/arsenite/antimonite-responsive transcriptional repressor
VSSELLHTVDVSKALAHPGRLRILAMLRGGPLCVCQITAVLELATSTVSGHLLELRRAGLVLEQKQGRWVFYRLTEDSRLLALLSPIFTLFDRDDRVLQDAATIAQVRSVPVEVLCRVGLDLAAAGVTRTGEVHRARASVESADKGRLNDA